MKEYTIEAIYKGKDTVHKVVAESFSKAVKKITNETGIGKEMYFSQIEFNTISIKPIHNTTKG
jgi:hypothetical protein